MDLDSLFDHSHLTVKDSQRGVALEKAEYRLFPKRGESVSSQLPAEA